MKNNKPTVLMLFLAMTICYSSFAQQEAVVVEGYTTDLFGRRTQDLSKLPKMERDIEILKNVLDDLFSSSENFFDGGSAEGIYIEGKGVMFTMNGQSRYGGLLVTDELTVMNVQTGEAEEEEQSVEDINAGIVEKLDNNSKDFLLNYASLLSELKPGEKVILNVDYTLLRERTKGVYGTNQTLFISDRNNGGKRMVSEISHADLNAFLDGKTNESTAKGKIKTSSFEKNNESSNDTRIFAGILDDLFSSSQEGTWRRRSKTTYTYFEGFGLMYNMKFTTSSRSPVYVEIADGGGGTATVRSSSSEEQQKKREEYYKKLEENYPEFEKMLKESFLEYGRTLRSVKDDEVIIVNVDLGSSPRNSKIPRSLQMVIPKNTINAYSRGNLSLEKAAEAIDIKKLNTSLYNGRGSGLPFTAPEAEAVTIVEGYRAQGRN